MKYVVSILVISAVMFGLQCGSSTHSVAEKEAVAAAVAWLQLIDSANYSQSWDKCAEFFQSAIDKPDWIKAMAITRKPLGKLLSRKLESAKYSDSLPGAPDGEYVVIQFQTEFENKKNTLETVTPLKEVDGQWRVSGYYIK